MAEAARTLAAAFGPQIGPLPLWEIVVVLGLSAAIVTLALRSRVQPYTSQAPEVGLAIISEVENVDRTLSAHANGVLTLTSVAAGAFATIVQTDGGPGIPLIFAATVFLLTGFTVAAVGLGMAGGVTAAAALSPAQLQIAVERNLRRAHRRTQCVRAATACLFLNILLVVVSIAAVRN